MNAREFRSGRRGAASALFAVLALPPGLAPMPETATSPAIVRDAEDAPIELAQRRGRRDLASDLDSEGHYKPDPIYSDKAFGLGSGLMRSRQVRNNRRKEQRRPAKPAGDDRKRLRGEDQKDEERAERAAARGEAAE